MAFIRPLNEEFHPHTMYARVEQLVTVQDYAPGESCMRLVGVSPQSFETEAFNLDEGCETYILDIARPWRFPDLWPLSQTIWSPRFEFRFDWDWWVKWMKNRHPHRENFEDDLERWWLGRWVKVRYELSPVPTSAYAYTAFRGGTGPTYLKILEIQRMRGPNVLPPPPASTAHTFPDEHENAAVTLDTFHVGQGMCSLFSGPTVGYLLDAGAGTPIKRRTYQNSQSSSGTSFRNDLLKAVKPLQHLTAIISHADRDHWSLLEWDPWLLSKVGVVLLPSGAPTLAFASPVIKPKVKGMGDGRIPLNAKNELHIYRSRPHVKYPSRNHDALITVAVAGEKKALLPGDYVYKELKKDKSAPFANIPNGSFDAVVVPHHGDTASATSIPAPTVPGKSIAFFSAGDHKHYRHPTKKSLDSHAAEKYKVIEDHKCVDIIVQRLIS